MFFLLASLGAFSSFLQNIMDCHGKGDELGDPVHLANSLPLSFRGDGGPEKEKVSFAAEIPEKSC